jgi:glutamate/tyrosine decarboxylase-like PLP-dependent enzyme
MAPHAAVQALDRPLMVYVSSQAHSSVEKAALLAGFGRENMRVIPVDAQFDMRPDALASAILEDRARDAKPCAIVATCGSTATTAFDPLTDIARVARAIWLHVDAAMAGSAMILPDAVGSGMASSPPTR